MAAVPPADKAPVAPCAAGSRWIHGRHIYSPPLKSVKAERMRIIPGDYDDDRVVALLLAHVTRARAETGRGSAHALDPHAMRDAGLQLFAAWEAETLLGVAGLRPIGAGHGEVKSMFVAESARRRGVAAALLEHLVQAARAQGMTRLSLETGSWPYFAAARAFYARHGFAPCGPFGDYSPDPNSVFM